MRTTVTKSMSTRKLAAAGLRKVTAAIVLSTALASVAFAGIKVKVDNDPDVDFADFHSWAWHPKGPGNVIRLVSQDDDNSAAAKQKVTDRIVPIVAAELTRRGFPVATGEPDFYVMFYALITVDTTSQQLGQFLPTWANWGLPPFAPQTTSLKIYPQGSLVLDLTSRATNEVVWRGLAQAEMKWDDPEPKRDQRIREATASLLKKFPPKASKKR